MKRLMILAGLAIVLVGCTYKGQELISGDGFNFKDNTPGYNEYVKLEQGCARRDCMPVIDEPDWESREEADRWLGDEDVVLGLDYRGEHRAYPVKVMNWHEIVNDEVGGEAVAVTYAARCGSAVVLKRQGLVGVSGKLKYGCPVMYDRETRSLWEQVTGGAIVGERKGEKWGQVPVQVLSWKEWRMGHPATAVLARAKGGKIDYEAEPYPEEEGREVVYGVRVGGQAKAYTLTAVKRETADDGVLVDTVGGGKLRLSYRDGEILVENLRTKSKIIPMRMFKFAWMAYYPEMEIYD